MIRYLIAATAVLAFGSHALTQTPPKTVLPAPTPMVVPPAPVPQSLSVPQGFFVSGGALIGSNGSYPYDSGMYLLGGSDTARVTGYYRMVYPGSPGGPPLPATTTFGSGRTGCSCRW
jgi:hypothetical protein